MPIQILVLLLAALFSSALSGQPAGSEPVTRTIRFTHSETDRVLQETATDLRGITEISQISVNTADKTLTLHGTASQVGLAEWLLTKWDSSAPPQPPDYRVSSDDIVRIFPLAHAPAVQVLQDIANAIKTFGDIRRIYTYNPPNAITVRGNAPQIALAQWLIRQLDQPANQSVRNDASHEYRPAGGADDVVRVFYAAHASTVQGLREIASEVRSIVGFRRLFTFNQTGALIVRGTGAQMLFAEWLVNELDQPANQPARTQGPHEYRPSGAADDVVKVFFLTHGQKQDRVQQIATEVRSASGVRTLFIYNEPRALTLRGTAAQIASAGPLIAERDR